jgi:hypothetical protein
MGEGDPEGVATTTMSTFGEDILKAGRMETIMVVVKDGITTEAVAELKQEEDITLTVTSKVLIIILVMVNEDGTYEMGEVAIRIGAGSNKITAIAHKAVGDLATSPLITTAIKARICY